MYELGYGVQQTCTNAYDIYIYNHKIPMEYKERSTQHSIITYMGKDPKRNRQIH